MRLFVSAWMVLSFGLTGSAFAQNTPPGFDAAKWSNLVNQIIEKGTPMDSQMGSWRTLSNIVPADTAKSHQADYISTVGGIDMSGKYVAGLLYAVSENWQLDAQGNWDIDQWIYGLSVDGELTQVTHIDLKETADRTVLSDQAIPTGGPSDPAELAHWGQKLDQWLSQAAPERIALP